MLARAFCHPSELGDDLLGWPCAARAPWPLGCPCFCCHRLSSALLPVGFRSVFISSATAWPRGYPDIFMLGAVAFRCFVGGGSYYLFSAQHKCSLCPSWQPGASWASPDGIHQQKMPRSKARWVFVLLFHFQVPISENRICFSGLTHVQDELRAGGKTYQRPAAHRRRPPSGARRGLLWVQSPLAPFLHPQGFRCQFWSCFAKALGARGMLARVTCVRGRNGWAACRSDSVNLQMP